MENIVIIVFKKIYNRLFPIKPTLSSLKHLFPKKSRMRLKEECLAWILHHEGEKQQNLWCERHKLNYII